MCDDFVNNFYMLTSEEGQKIPQCKRYKSCFAWMEEGKNGTKTETQ